MELPSNESPESTHAWLGRARPRQEAACLLGQECADERSDANDIALRDLVMRPLTRFDDTLHPFASVSQLGVGWFTPALRDLLRIYGPAGEGEAANIQQHYSREWAYTDPYGHISVYARPRLATGRFAAGHSLTNGYGQALAALGVVIVPDLEWCELSIRPYVSYQGSTYLSGRRPRDAWQNATSTTWASIGILVESWAVGGGSYHLDWDQPTLVSSFSETNPTSSWRDFGGSVSVSDGLTAKILATRHRRYRIWVYCWAEVQAQMLASAGAYATTSIDCSMPFLIVEQVKL